MKKINSIGTIIDLNHINKNSWKYKYGNFFKFLNKIQGNNLSSYVIDISNIFEFKKNKIKYKFNPVNKKQFFLKPKNILELYKISKKLNCISMYHLPDNLNFTLKQFILKILGFKRFSILGLGYISDNAQAEKTSVKNKLRYIVNVKITYYLYRLMQIIGINKNIDYAFLSSDKDIKKINDSISNKIYKYTKLVNLSFYRKKYRINSQPYTNFLEKRFGKISNDYIVFADSGFDHGDRTLRDGKPKNWERDKFYEYLNNFLSDLSKIVKKKVVFCLHPKAKYGNNKNFNKIKKKFKCVLRETEKYIYKADIVVFFESSTIINAILLKKKIINLNSSLMGQYYFKRNNLYKNNMNIYQMNLDNFSLPRKNKLYKILNNRLSNYDKYIKDQIINETNISLFKQVNKILLKDFFNKK